MRSADREIALYYAPMRTERAGLDSWTGPAPLPNNPPSDLALMLDRYDPRLSRRIRRGLRRARNAMHKAGF